VEPLDPDDPRPPFQQVANAVRLGDETATIYDPMGKDAVLFHFATSEDSGAVGTQYIAEAQKWFDSVWETVGRPFTP